MLHDLVHAAQGLEVVWLSLDGDSALVGHSIGASRVRSLTGASIVAISRNATLIPNPDASATLESGDRIAVIGTPAQVDATARLTRH